MIDLCEIESRLFCEVVDKEMKYCMEVIVVFESFELLVMEVVIEFL